MLGKEVFTSIVCEKVLVEVNEYPILREIDLQVAQGERVAIVGPNAAGKSTLLKVISGEVVPSKGRILLNGLDIHQYAFKKRARILTKVPQNSKNTSNFSVWDYVAMGRYPYQGFSSSLTRDDLDAIQKAIQLTNLGNLEERSVQELSGGEQQRVLLAQALAQETSLLLLDEPMNYLDLRYQMELMVMLMRINVENGKTVVAILHDLNVAAEFADRIILMDEGKVVGDGKTWDILTEANIEKVYGVRARVIELPGYRQLHYMIDQSSLK